MVKHKYLSNFDYFFSSFDAFLGSFDYDCTHFHEACYYAMVYLKFFFLSILWFETLANFPIFWEFVF